MNADLITESCGESVLDVALAAWIETKARRSSSTKTYRTYTSTMARFQAALAAVGLTLVSDPAAVATVAQAWADSNDPATATYNQRLAIISSFYSFARRRGLLTLDNPINRVERRPVQPYAGVLALAPAEIRRGLNAIDRSNLTGQRDYVLLSVALITGRRVSEMASLRWQHFHIEADGRVLITFPRVKGGKVMHDLLPLTISTMLLNYVQMVYGDQVEHLEPDTPIWISLSRANRGQALHPNWLERIARARLGIHFHALRHAFARALEESGAKVSEIQMRLGHESLSTTGRYLNALRRAENPHAEQLAKLFGLG